VEIYDGPALIGAEEIDQQTNSGQWNSLGSYTFSVAAKVIVYSSSSECSTCADAVSFVPYGTVVVDNGAAGSSFTGLWQQSGGAYPYGGTSLYSKDVDAEYAFEASLNGAVEVSIWWTEWSSRCTNIRIDVFDDTDLLDSLTINQQNSGGQWNILDTYTFDHSVKVVVNSEGDYCSTCADAARFVPTSEGTLDRIEIEGLTVINENSTYDYSCRAYYSNGTNRIIEPDNWKEDSQYATISSTGLLSTTGGVEEDEYCQITASYDEDGITKEAWLDITITARECSLDSRFEETTLTGNIEYYTDRSYTITDVPSEFIGMNVIKTPNEDRNLDCENDYLTFEVPYDTEVYVAFDRRATGFPFWLNDFLNTGYIIQTSLSTQQYLRVYSRFYSAGECVHLGCNKADGFTGDTVSNFILFYETPSSSYASIVIDNRNPDATADIVIDNGDSGTSYIGDWSVSGGTDPYGGGSLFSRAIGAAYTFESVAVRGTYEVYIWSSKWSSRCTEVQVEIYDGPALIGAEEIDQQTNSGQWNSLGSYTFSVAAKVIVYSSSSECSTCADAVSFVPYGTVVVDNGAAGSSFTGLWQQSGGAYPYGGTSLYSKDVDAEYAFEASLNGAVEVSIWWTEWSSRCTNIRIDVFDDTDLLDSLTINQQNSGGQWNILDTYTFDHSVKVVVNSEGDYCSTCADAARFVPTSEGTLDRIEIEGLTVINENSTYDYSCRAYYSNGTNRIIEPDNWKEDSQYATISSTGLLSTTGGVEEDEYCQITASYDEDGITKEAWLDITITARECSLDSRFEETTLTGNIEYYTDRSYTITDVPSEFIGMNVIKTPNEDRNLDCENDYLTFEVPYDTEVYVAFDRRATGFPFWLNDFLNTGYIIQTSLSTQQYLRVYSRFYSAGECVHLGCNKADGFTGDTVSNFILFYETPSSSYASIVIDNRNPDATFTGDWSVSGGPDPYNIDSVYGRDDDTFTWTFSPDISDEYEIGMWWTEWTSRSTNIPVHIEYSGGTDTIYINQQEDGGKWNSLGKYYFESGEDYAVTIIAQHGPSSTCADAVSFSFAYNDPFVQIVYPYNTYLQSDSIIFVNANAKNLPFGWGVEFVLDIDNANEKIIRDFNHPYQVEFVGLGKKEYTVDAFTIVWGIPLKSVNMSFKTGVNPPPAFLPSCEISSDTSSSFVPKVILSPMAT